MRLLLPATQIQVLGKIKPSSDLHIIHLKEVKSPHPLLQSSFSTLSITSLTAPNPIAQDIKVAAKNGSNSASVTELYENKPLKKTLDTMKGSPALNLSKKQLNDDDTKIVANDIKINSTRSNISLNDNQITSIGAQYLAKAFQTNTT
ncbi:unnamed protein product [Didymodactylos carnosus]|uniref:Uncharacterized protein n=1 Tax=Didymodactylos carnosus TaxID=1234261 RepID=A0A815YQ43_9BILA|nr:unnamed protein product [Didymodactylos carnosus]CAF1574722.1 unnamed protein product [Didymodactylos carnosus]CAF4197249.1 unnamed protein product [Didymodactylos carnosus]CAF4439418.1 unnamed protein product [Didymodactylos carnosus]